MPKKPLDIIVAFERSRGIGKAGTIPWHLPADLKRFSEITKTTEDPDKQNAVLMGRVTWESLPDKYRPLPHRRNIVLSTSLVELSGATVVRSFHSALRIINHDDSIERIFVIGGAQVYLSALDYAERLYVTELYVAIDCDAHFPVIDPSQFTVQRVQRPEHYCGVDFTYKTYTRINK